MLFPVRHLVFLLFFLNFSLVDISPSVRRRRTSSRRASDEVIWNPVFECFYDRVEFLLLFHLSLEELREQIHTYHQQIFGQAFQLA